MRIFLFILLLPFFAAVGHDIYINHFSDDKKIRAIKRLDIDVEKFQVSDLGWVWREYAEENFDIVKASFAKETWEKSIDPILQMPTMVVSIIPFLLVAVIALLTYGVRNRATLMNFATNRRAKKDEFTVYKHSKANAMKFKKK